MFTEDDVSEMASAINADTDTKKIIALSVEIAGAERNAKTARIMNAPEERGNPEYPENMQS